MITYDTPIDASGAVPGVDGTASERRRAGQAARDLAGGRELLRLALDAIRLRPVAGATPTPATSSRCVTAFTGRGLQHQAAPAGAHAERRLPLPPGRNRRVSHDAVQARSSNGHQGRRHHRHRAAVVGGDGARAPGAARRRRRVPLKRFVTVYQPGGAVRSGAERRQVHARPGTRDVVHDVADPDAAAARCKSRLLIVDGLNLTCGDQSKYSVEQHQGGSVGWLTGAIQHGGGQLPAKIARPSTRCWRRGCRPARPYGSLQLAVRWATGKSHGKLSPINAMNFCGTTARRSRRGSIRRTSSPRCSAAPGGTGGTGGTDPNALALMRKKSILDFVDKRYDALKAKLGRRRSRAARPAPDAGPRARAAHRRSPRRRRRRRRPASAHQGGHDGLQPDAARSTRPTTAASRTPRPT